jgi:hypothetical protein
MKGFKEKPIEEVNENIPINDLIDTKKAKDLIIIISSSHLKNPTKTQRFKLKHPTEYRYLLPSQDGVRGSHDLCEWFDVETEEIK